MKINVEVDWDKAPEWANYFAMDEDGSMYFYESLPVSEKSSYSSNWCWWNENGGNVSCLLMNEEDIDFKVNNWKDSLQHLRDECAKFPNVYFLERDTKIIDDVVFVGGTLWTDMNRHDPLTLHAVRDMMMDYRMIKNDEKGFTNLKPTDTVLRHRETLQYIKMVVDEHKDKRCVVVGHHTPSFQSCHEQYRSEHLMNGAYHSDLSETILDRPQIKLWTHGHTHNAFDYVIGDTRVVCNPRGYQSVKADGTDWGEDTGFDPKLVIEL